jgi:DNA helicase-2/ATP-dependent DNA helicase PcrA
MIKRVLRDLDIDDKRHPPKSIASRIDRAKQDLLGPTELDGDDPPSVVARQVYALYEERMAAAGALDFGDLIHRFARAIEADDELRAELAHQFRHILVDEFQDTNHAQLRLVRALASVHRNLCVVGDDDQSIYRWRGADRRNILDFQKAVPEAVVVKLEQNYRSTQRILRAAHAVIRRNEDREPKELWTDNPDGSAVLVVRTTDELDEARMVVRGVSELRSLGQPLADMAVFYRIHAQSRVLEEALRASNVAYRVVGGMRFYERAEVKDALAYLRVLQNPNDDVSLLRILNVPTRGIGKTTEERLLSRAAEDGRGVFHAIEAAVDGNELGAAARKKLGAFRDLMASFSVMLAEGAGVAELAEAVLERTGYLEALRREDSAEAEARLQNLQELVGSLVAFERDREDASLATFLEEITLDSAGDEVEAEDRLTLMTVHAAKGLEFRTVMVTGMEEKMFPFRGLELWDDPEELEEERRLAYVAITRARERLVLSYAERRTIFGQMRVGIPSRFLGELPADDVQFVGGRPPRPASAARSPRAAWEDDHIDAPPSRASRANAGESYLDTSEGADIHPGAELRAGMRVRHAKFGTGRVREVVFGTPLRARVEFPDHGVRNIVVSFLELA